MCDLGQVSGSTEQNKKQQILFKKTKLLEKTGFEPATPRSQT